MTLTGTSGAQHSYSCDFAGIANTALPVTNVEELTWCIETLEAYGITAATDYPNTFDTPMTHIDLETGTTHPVPHLDGEQRDHRHRAAHRRGQQRRHRLRRGRPLLQGIGADQPGRARTRRGQCREPQRRPSGHLPHRRHGSNHERRVGARLPRLAGTAGGRSTAAPPPAGAPVHGVSRSTDKLDIFVTGTDRNTYTRPPGNPTRRRLARLVEPARRRGRAGRAGHRGFPQRGPPRRVRRRAPTAASTPPRGNRTSPTGGAAGGASATSSRRRARRSTPCRAAPTSSTSSSPTRRQHHDRRLGAGFADGWHGWWQINGGAAAPGARGHRGLPQHRPSRRVRRPGPTVASTPRRGNPTSPTGGTAGGGSATSSRRRARRGTRLAQHRQARHLRHQLAAAS